MIEQIEAIRNEIKRLKDPHERNLNKPMERGRIGYAHGCIDCCDKILDFLDTLSEEHDKDLSEKIAAAYQLGLANKEEQMMKEAVEAEISAKSPIVGRSLISVISGLKDFKYGDKVRIIIVKEDNQ